LAVSGEKWEQAIQPKIAMQQLNWEVTEHESKEIVNHTRDIEQYFKFVCDATDEDFAEVERAMNEYYEGGISRNTDVYIMPVACTEEQQQTIAAKVAKMCMDRGYIYCHRIQNSVFGNGVGT
jgi:CRISPR/Cas system-associated endoribonuclease Cas2